MGQRPAPLEFILEAFVDPNSARDVVRGILHTIFFHRFFPTVLPRTREVLDLTLPYVDDAELETLIDQRTATLVRQLDAERTTQSHSSHPYQSQNQSGGQNHSGGRGQITVQFFEKRRRKAWYSSMRGMGMGITGITGGGGNNNNNPSSPTSSPSSAEEEVCWESWTLKVTVAEPRTESERAKVRRAMEATLLASVMKIVTAVNTHRDHIPPITTTEANPFPYRINVNQKEPPPAAAAVGWAARIGLY